jgi:hypothetical protein
MNAPAGERAHVFPVGNDREPTRDATGMGESILRGGRYQAASTRLPTDTVKDPDRMGSASAGHPLRNDCLPVIRQRHNLTRNLQYDHGLAVVSLVEPRPQPS